jgi:hypothetical protein
MTKLITIPKFVAATGLPYRLCLHLSTGQIPSVAVDAVAGSMCVGWSNGWRRWLSSGQTTPLCNRG